MAKEHQYVSPHARQRAFERYGVMLSARQCRGLYETLRKGKNAIFLTRENGGFRTVCFFDNRWFFLVCNENNLVLSFLPKESLTSEERRRLRHDPVYRRINKDQFGLFDRVVGLEDLERPAKKSKSTTKPPRKPDSRNDRPIRRLSRDPVKAEDFFDDDADRLFSESE